MNVNENNYRNNDNFKSRDEKDIIDNFSTQRTNESERATGKMITSMLLWRQSLDQRKR